MLGRAFLLTLIVSGTILRETAQAKDDTLFQDYFGARPMTVAESPVGWRQVLILDVTCASANKQLRVYLRRNGWTNRHTIEMGEEDGKGMINLPPGKGWLSLWEKKGRQLLVLLREQDIATTYLYWGLVELPSVSPMRQSAIALPEVAEQVGEATEKK